MGLVLPLVSYTDFLFWQFPKKVVRPNFSSAINLFLEDQGPLTKQQREDQTTVQTTRDLVLHDAFLSDAFIKTCSICPPIDVILLDSTEESMLMAMAEKDFRGQKH